MSSVVAETGNKSLHKFTPLISNKDLKVSGEKLCRTLEERLTELMKETEWKEQKSESDQIRVFLCEQTKFTQCKWPSLRLEMTIPVPPTFCMNFFQNPAYQLDRSINEKLAELSVIQEVVNQNKPVFEVLPIDPIAWATPYTRVRYLYTLLDSVNKNMGFQEVDSVDFVAIRKQIFPKEQKGWVLLTTSAYNNLKPPMKLYRRAENYLSYMIFEPVSMPKGITHTKLISCTCLDVKDADPKMVIPFQLKASYSRYLNSTIAIVARYKDSEKQKSLQNKTAVA